MEIRLIDTVSGLEDCCAELMQHSWMAVDTEFMREKTYYPQLCLIQIAGEKQLFCIDTLSLNETVALKELLLNRSIIKVFHAARQDLEVLDLLCGMPPAPVFDTQIAAGLLGYDDQLGYAALVETMTGTKLEKGHQRTDWSKRPFADDQLKYAADDVRYLSAIYPVLFERLEQLGRLGWALEDCARLTNVSLYAANPELAYLRIKQGRTLDCSQQHVLKSLASWRERVAQKKDRPRNWIARDGLLVYLAQSQPGDIGQLQKARGLSEKLMETEGEAILTAIANSEANNETRIFDPAEPLTPAQTELRDNLMSKLKLKADELGIRPTVLAPRREVDVIARGSIESSLLSGWRRQLIGEELLSFCEAAPKG